MKITTKYACALLMGAMMSISSMAAPSESSLNELGAIMPYEAVFFEMVVAPINQDRLALIYSLQNDTNLTDVQREKALQAFDDYAEKMLKQLDTDANKAALKKAYISSARTHFTQAEIDAQIAFYGSQNGQSALQKTDKVYADFIKAVAPSAEQTLSDYQKTNFTKMQDELKRILNK